MAPLVEQKPAPRKYKCSYSSTFNRKDAKTYFVHCTEISTYELSSMPRSEVVFLSSWIRTQHLKDLNYRNHTGAERTRNPKRNGTEQNAP